MVTPSTYPSISLIACISRNGAIGYRNKLLYHIKDDMQRFVSLTTGHTIIMGRNTFLSLPHGALPNRRNMVVSTTLPPTKGIEIYSSLSAALQQCQHHEEVFIIGGEALYQETLPLANRLYLTLVEDTPQKADAFFPLGEKDILPIPIQNWSIICEATKKQGSLTYHFIDLQHIVS